MGKLFFNDPLWDIYDVVITVDAYSVSQSMHSRTCDETPRRARARPRGRGRV